MAIEHVVRRVFDLSSASILIFEQTPEQARAVAHDLRSFGARKIQEVVRLEDARASAVNERLDLIIADPQAGHGQAMDFLRWTRREPAVINRIAPIILLASPSAQSAIRTMRMAGANFIVAKPYKTETLRSRVSWVGRDQRPFVETETYVGPCRRTTPGGRPVRGVRRAADALVLEPAAASR